MTPKSLYKKKTNKVRLELALTKFMVEVMKLPDDTDKKEALSLVKKYFYVINSLIEE